MSVVLVIGGAVRRLEAGSASRAYNLVTDVSVRDILAARLVASNEWARRDLAWTPASSDSDAIIGTAWRWHSAHPQGYDDALGASR